MVDENKFMKIFNIVKYIAIGVIILGFLLFFAYTFLNYINKNKLENYLKTQGFKEENNIWTKTTNTDYSNSTYLYDSKINKFYKETSSNYSNYQEQIKIKYNGTNNLEIDYSYDDNECFLVQAATYNYKNNDFKCSVKYNSNNCDLKCDVLYNETKNFSKELTDILKKATVNDAFLVKNKD